MGVWSIHPQHSLTSAGIAYQLSEADPLEDGDQCQRDAELMSTLGANAIRVYHVDASGNHDACMSAFSAKGIYLFLDLDTFDTQIDATAPHWNQTQYDAFTDVLDAFHSYDNLAGVFIGNEVVTQANQSAAAVYVKAAARDVKAHRDSKGYRKIPVGYSAADIAQLRPMLQDYLVCGGNASEAIDFFSLNAYEWCGQTNYQLSGYATLQTEAQGYPVPIFFSETGCITVRPRTFDDQAAIFGSEMESTWSGAIVYEWLQEANNYGIISYGPGPTPAPTPAAPDIVITRSGTPTPVTPDFANLKTAWAAASPTGVALSAYSGSAASLSTPACPSSTAGPSGWAVDGNPSIPAVGQTFNPTATAQVANASPSARASASATHGGAAGGGKEFTGMTLGLTGVMLSFVIWL